ncbi:MAG: SDR family oxidoreductase [Pseudodesulfovibrio sp.]|uniref:Short-chain dehydrogenase/reductase SDR n=1 Tax=Pseudodesulfovibrio aespoeensis (strain ATCC 700646 / DSM 10631 / Aspo-2) TaxID=643562 RepID=E6VSS8_PSEA9|nr:MULTISPECIES: SDR family oxidoreductase [Pseudodesulfovibrio]MBU4244367.1 SDR family oxidoreductase [Pseudomonadota bacterium]ADU63172.1 short-chain dehydrogenase/reductase SDR [Pseudodesulfovibrio aespoeensis Aspo-2]MBU4378283.1 SDR family oxidoreductase [Pseudomonadota bacterium]MBU4475969.1 SDR family oxidoreductase [Pseudomonadota bacterium]MBU4516882.1 SDR family oxidoreductase [Pseudomonadota bacterium]
MKKNVLITGGNKGIGLEASRLFIERGYHVYAVARDFSGFELAGSDSVTAVKYDLTDLEGIPALVAGLGPVDVLVNNAGVMYALPYDNYPANKVDAILRLNLQAPVALIREVSMHMVAQGSGRIVNNASIAGQIGHPDVWYGVTKAGLINLTKSFAKLLGPSGVVVNAVAPGPAETDMLHVIPDARKKAILQAVYTSRFARAREVAEAILWLGADCPEYINGTCIDINNGAFPR